MLSRVYNNKHILLPMHATVKIQRHNVNKQKTFMLLQEGFKSASFVEGNTTQPYGKLLSAFGVRCESHTVTFFGRDFASRKIGPKCKIQKILVGVVLCASQADTSKSFLSF
jgi:hypothetical protein